MKTDELTGKYKVEDNTENAREMLGAGYKHEPRRIVQEISGFYPLFEALLEKYRDEITPAVFGVVWRFCQMEDGVCKASLRTIAAILNVDDVTVMRRLKVLCEDEYLIDTTPDLKNRPHVYVDAGLVVMTSATGVRIETASHRSRSASHRKATASVSQLIKDSNKGFEEDEALAQITKAYESEIGVLTAMIADELRDAATTYPLKWVLDAIREAAANNARSWKYVEAILKRWRAQGNQEPARKPSRSNGKRPAQPVPPAETPEKLAARRALADKLLGGVK